MPALFLDIDGVMISGRSHAENLRWRTEAARFDHMPSESFDASAVAFVNLLAGETGAKIVLHSDWRRHLPRQTLQLYLLGQGIPDDIFHEDWWVEAPFGQRKQEAIAVWLDAHVEETLWCAIDDDAIFAPAKNLACNETRRRLRDFKKRHVRVDPENGITLADYRRALKLLGAGDPRMETPRLGR